MIPPAVYQTWITKDEAAWSPSGRRWVSSWRAVSGARCELSDDADCLAFVRERFPKYLKVYSQLRPVEKADLWRYLVIYERGGVYGDFDTLCRKPLADWLRPSDGLVLGLETDLLDEYPAWTPSGHVRSGGAYRLGGPWIDNPVLFCNWTFAARPGHPLLADVIRRVAINALDPFFLHERPGWTIKKTGPGALTDAVNDYLERHGSSAREVALELRNRSETIVGDVRFLDWSAFHHRLVKHVGLGSWKPRGGVLEHALRNLRIAFSAWGPRVARSGEGSPGGA